MNTFDSELEALMNAVEADVEILPRTQQASTQVSFMSVMNPNGGSFSYGSLEDSKYAGMPLSLSATGSVDPTTHIGNWTSAASLGTLSWTGTVALPPMLLIRRHRMCPSI